MNANESITLLLPAGQVLTITAPSGVTGSVVRLPRTPGGGNSQSTTAINGANLTFGPYANPERFQINCTAGTVTYSTAAYDPQDPATDLDLATLTAAVALKAPIASPTFTGTAAFGVLTLPEKTPVNAVAASKQITFTGNAVDNETVTIGANVYRFQNAINGAGVAATGLLTVSDTPHEGETVVIGTAPGAKTYKWRAAIGAGVIASQTLNVADVPHATGAIILGGATYTFVAALTEAKATSTLTLTANATDGNSVTIGSTKYTFKETLGAAYDVKIGASASDTIDNLIAAINKAAGESSTYGAGTVAHPDVTAAVGAGDTMGITAKVPGVAGNAIATTELSAVCSWTDTVMASGVDPIANEVLIGGTAEASIDNLVLAITAGSGAGTNYATGTVAHTTCTAVKATAATMTASAQAVGFAANAYGTTLGGGANDHLTWDGVTLTGGVDAEAANDVLIGANAEAAIDNLVLAITHGATEGTNYGTGTVAHTQVTAVKASAATMTVTAAAIGDAGNAYATTTTATHCSFGAATLTGGEGVEAANDILIGVSPEASIDNLVAAIAGTGAGTTCGTGTTANASVTAVKVDTDKITATAKVKGVVGNSIAIAETVGNATWAGGATALSGGVDGTVGVANETCADGSYIYHAIAANTTADTNWRRVSLGTAY